MPKTSKTTAKKNAPSRLRLSVGTKPRASAPPTADDIAEMATRGEDVSAYFTNRFTVVRPVRPVNLDSTHPLHPASHRGRDKVR